MTGVDIFAGLGGNTAGAEAAGVRILWAANHSRAAVDCHASNHPYTHHSCQDLHQADFSEVPDHDAAFASPDCRGHTNARGKEKPRHDKYRATAWAVISLAEAKRPALLIVENVPAFLNWSLYPSWADALRRLGYSLSPHIVDSANHGVPQHRVRVFIICTKSKSPLFLSLPRRPLVAASAFIDLASGEWSDWRQLCDRTRARIRTARKQFGPRFIAPYYSSGSGLSGRSLDRPIGTITTIDRWQVIDGFRSRFLSVDEFRAAMGFPAGYVLPANKHLAKFMLGQAVCPPVVTDILTALKALS